MSRCTNQACQIHWHEQHTLPTEASTYMSHMKNKQIRYQAMPYWIEIFVCMNEYDNIQLLASKKKYFNSIALNHEIPKDGFRTGTPFIKRKPGLITDTLSVDFDLRKATTRLAFWIIVSSSRHNHHYHHHCKNSDSRTLKKRPYNLYEVWIGGDTPWIWNSVQDEINNSIGLGYRAFYYQIYAIRNNLQGDSSSGVAALAYNPVSAVGGTWKFTAASA